MTSGRLDGQRSMGSLLRDLAEGSATLVKNEVRLARLEVSTMLRAVGMGTAEIAVGGVLALLALALVPAGREATEVVSGAPERLR